MCVFMCSLTCRCVCTGVCCAPPPMEAAEARGPFIYTKLSGLFLYKFSLNCNCHKRCLVAVEEVVCPSPAHDFCKDNAVCCTQTRPALLTGP